MISYLKTISKLFVFHIFAIYISLLILKNLGFPISIGAFYSVPITFTSLSMFFILTLITVSDIVEKYKGNTNEQSRKVKNRNRIFKI